MRIFFSVGEPSGDLHAANLIRRLKQLQPDVQAVGFGGSKMEAAGCQVLFDLTSMAVMFIGGAIKNIRTFLGLVKDADKYFAANKIDAVVLIDYPGFNWWIARKAKKHGIPVFYYGVPQMWAWAPWRISKIRKFVDHVICKLPFEPKWFNDRGCEAFYVGHPYFDQLHQQQLDDQFIEQITAKKQEIVLLLPGSRDQEVKQNVDCLLNSAELIRKSYPDAHFVMGCFNEKHREFVSEQCASAEVEIYVGRTQELMATAKTCIACSGSVSLELLYHRLPSVIVFNVKRWVYLVQGYMLRCKFISLPNLMYTDDISRSSRRPYDPDAPDAERVVMPEYLTATDCSPQVAGQIVRLLESEKIHGEAVDELEKLAAGYALPGATTRAADYIIQNLTGESQVVTRAA